MTGDIDTDARALQPRLFASFWEQMVPPARSRSISRPCADIDAKPPEGYTCADEHPLFVHMPRDITIKVAGLEQSAGLNFLSVPMAPNLRLCTDLIGQLPQAAEPKPIPEGVEFYSVPVSYGAEPVADEKKGFFNPGPDIVVTERRSDGGRILDPENVTPAKKPEGERKERRG